MSTLATTTTVAPPLDPLAEMALSLENALLNGDESLEEFSKERRHLALVVATYQAIFTDNFAAFESLLTPDAEFITHGPPHMPMTGRVAGWQAILRRVIENFSSVTDQRVEVIEVIGQGDKLSILLHETGRFCATGRQYDVHVTQWFRFRDGRVASIRQVTDTFSLMEAGTKPEM